MKLWTVRSVLHLIHCHRCVHHHKQDLAVCTPGLAQPAILTKISGWLCNIKWHLELTVIPEHAYEHKHQLFPYTAKYNCHLINFSIILFTVVQVATGWKGPIKLHVIYACPSLSTMSWRWVGSGVGERAPVLGEGSASHSDTPACSVAGAHCIRKLKGHHSHTKQCETRTNTDSTAAQPTACHCAKWATPEPT
jgi:hypothetical protein